MNGKPYYSADNGFACAAAGRGITEALQEHLNVIIRDEDLELEPTHSQLQSEINDLVEDKERTRTTENRPSREPQGADR